MKEVGKKKSFKETFTFISTIISWTVFTLLVICIILLLYYFISTQLYARKGDKYEPKFSLYTIISPSMVPNIKVYDVVVNFRIESPESVNIGDVITFTSTSPESMGNTVTHRVVSIIKDEDGNYSYQTKGDNNLIEDTSPVPYANLIGRVALKIPHLGRVQFFIASSYGWLLIVLIPALYIIIKDIFKIIKLKFPNCKFTRVMSTPLLTGKRIKLLPEPKMIEREVEEEIKHIEISDLFDNNNDDDLILPDLKE